MQGTELVPALMKPVLAESRKQLKDKTVNDETVRLVKVRLTSSVASSSASSAASDSQSMSLALPWLWLLCLALPVPALPCLCLPVEDLLAAALRLGTLERAGLGALPDPSMSVSESESESDRMIPCPERACWLQPVCFFKRLHPALPYAMQRVPCNAV